MANIQVGNSVPAGNPIRDVASKPFQVPMDSGGLVVDGIYGVRDIVDLFVSRNDDVPDPRSGYVNAPGRQRTWQIRPTPDPNGWISPSEPGGVGALKDIFVRFNFDRIQSVNRVAFELANVPCNWSLWFLDPDRNEITQLTDLTGAFVGGTLTGRTQVAGRTPGSSLEDLLPSTSVGISNYLGFAFKIPNIRTAMFELRMDRRIPETLLPLYLRSRATAPYPLAVRKFRFRYAVTSRSELPPDDADIRFKHALGFVERAQVNELSADRAIDEESSTYWLSEAQPSADCIVPFFMDVRDQDGNAQVIDQIQTIPVTTGPHMNIYYSEDDATSSFFISRTRRLLTVWGTTTREDDLGMLCDAAGEGATMSNDMVRMDLSKDWGVGLVYEPQYDSTVGGTTKRFLWEWSNAGGSKVGVCFDPATQTFQVVQGGSVVLAQSQVVSFSNGDLLWVLFAYVNTQSDPALQDPDYPPGYWFNARPVNEYADGYHTAGFFSPTWFHPDTFTIGSNQALTAPADGYLTHVWAKQTTYHGPSASAFALAPETFIQGLGPPDRTNGFHNAVFLARLKKSYVARVGPGEGYYDLKEWTPVWRDYVLRKGKHALPSIKAKYIKLEFTNLVPRPYAVIERKVKRVVREWPVWVTEWFRQVSASQGQGVRYITPPIQRGVFADNPTGLATPLVSPRGNGTRLPSLERYLARSDSRFQISQPTPISIIQRGYVPVDQYEKTGRGVITDSSLVSGLSSQSHRRRFFRKGRHEYIIREVEMIQNEAYFVGLKSIRAWRVDYTAADDTPEYIEVFSDDANLDFSADETVRMKRSPTNDYYRSDVQLDGTYIAQSLTTKIFNSLSKFKSIQIAVMGSGWESKFTDDELTFASQGHIEDIPGTFRADVTGQYTGGGGSVLLFTPIPLDQLIGLGIKYRSATIYDPTLAYDSASVPSNQAGEYGVTTREGYYVAGTAVSGYDSSNTYDSPDSYDQILGFLADGIRTSCMARILLPISNRGTYELRLYTKRGGVKTRVAVKQFTLPTQTWWEIPLGYIAQATDDDFQVELVQINSSVQEPFALDFLGIFQNPIKWEVCNDAVADGVTGVIDGTWREVLIPLGNPSSYVTLPDEDNRLALRATAMRPGAQVSGYTAVPWDIESPLVRRIPVD